MSRRAAILFPKDIVEALQLERLQQIINAAELTPPEDKFVDLRCGYRQVPWRHLSAVPRNRFERAIQRPFKLSRYRVAAQAALSATPQTCIISHMPRMSAAISNMMSLLGRRAPHLAFVFNFTELPRGRWISYFRRSAKHIQQFAMFSQYEKKLYADYFDIDIARIKPVIWTQDTPELAASTPVTGDQPYVCAVGGEGRDYATLLEALHGLSIKAILIVRPESLAGLSVPDNVEVMVNVPAPLTWRIAKESMGLVIPLLSEGTCCGHSTLVSGKLLGIPIVTTDTFATREYVEGRPYIQTTPPRNSTLLRAAIERLVDESVSFQLMADATREREIALHDRNLWSEYVSEFLREYFLSDESS